MSENAEIKEIELLCVIVNCGIGSKLIKSAKRYGISGATATLGKGTVNSRILDFMGLAEIKKEIIYMISEKSIAHRVMECLYKEFEFYKPNHGIAFTTPICHVAGSKSVKCDKTTSKRGTNIMYNAITVIVEKGMAEKVIKAAEKSGSKGGTVINARGSGIHETGKLFFMDIEPEKEIVLILSESHITDEIISSIRTSLKIDEPGNGIIYVQDVTKTYGIYK